MENENLYYSKKDEQQELLQKVLSANESAADEEDVPSHVKSSGSQILRTTGTLSSLSGGDEGLYMEVRRGQSNKEKNRHPLFKRFYTTGKK